MGHHIVSEALLVLGRPVEIELVDGRAHLLKRLVRNVETELGLTFSECDPEASPRSVAASGRKNLLHLARCISVRKRVHISIEVQLTPPVQTCGVIIVVAL